MDNVRSALARNLPTFNSRFEPHGGALHVAAGGPSLEDTWPLLKGKPNVVTVNKAHDFLLEKGIAPRACALLCPVPQLSHAFTPRKGVQYLVASMCHPFVFDKLKGFDVVVWHVSQLGDRNIEHLVPKGHLMVAGGSTASLRWINLGYMLGFRDFHLHAFDSSFRREGGKLKHHAYDYAQDDKIAAERGVEILGYPTYLALYSQVTDFFRTMDDFEKPQYDPCSFTLHGDGLLQHAWERYSGAKTHQTQKPVNDLPEPRAFALNSRNIAHKGDHHA